MAPDADVIRLLQSLLQDPTAAGAPLAGIGARRYERLSWSVDTFDSYVDGRAAQGFLLYNDGPTDALIGLNSTDVGASNDNAILTVRAGAWISLPIVSSVLFAGGPSVGTLLVFAFDYAPQPAAGSISGDPATAAHTHGVIDDASAGELALAENALRREAIIANGTGADIYVLYGNATEVSATNYTVKLADGAAFVMDKYTGDVSVFQTAAATGIQITEVA